MLWPRPSITHCARSTCATRTRSRTRWADMPPRYSPPSTPSAATPTNSALPRATRSSNTPTTRSSPASTASVTSPAPACGRDRRRPDPLHRRPSAQGLRRIRPRHPRIGAKHLRHPPHREKQPGRRSRIRLGLRRHPQTRPRHATLRPATSSRRPARRSAAQPLQPPTRPALPLPANPSDYDPIKAFPESATHSLEHAA